MDNEQETPKLTGIKAYHEKKRLEKEQKSSLRKQLESIKETSYQTETIEEIDFGIDINKTYVFEVLEKSTNSRHQILSATCKIFDGEQGRMRTIKYIPIADTIFVDEMGERYDGYPDQVLSLHNNQLTAEGSDVRLVEYLLSHDEYDGNPNRISKRPPLYTLVNKHDLEKRKEAIFGAKLKALNIINENAIEELMPIARVVFNIMDTDELIVKNKLRAYAETENNGSINIINNFGSPKTKRAYVVQASLDQGIIEVDVKNHSLVWAETKIQITEVRAVKDLEAQLSEITDFTFTPIGEKVYDVLKARVTF
ncbi:hypothetical protein [uncultured Clostridium sp.]|uniref:hypothetical protein n=1 Tax=uncultured Clostridium sp. TaxID=59620 RepID=UPI002633B8BF|nr:hypothetical protein [uncultured Clostridium sp.]